MVNFDDNSDDKLGFGEPVDATRDASEPLDNHAPHPLFPREDNDPERRDIRLVSFRRRRSDGRIDNSAEDIPAGEIYSWAQVIMLWGGGEYKVIGKDKNHRVVAWYPEKKGDWILFDLESKPFTLREQHHLSPHAAAPPAPLAPPALTPHEAALFELVRELRAAQALSTFSTETAMVELLKAQGELVRTVLSAVLPQRPGGASARPTIAPMDDMTLQLLRALPMSAPKAHAQGPVTARFGERLGRAASGSRAVRVMRKRR